MRFERLILGAFGPFTDETIDLSGGGPGGFHLVYGPNEAGKSTSLRAVKAFLFGFPERSVDAHTHGGGRLRVSAEITDGDQRHYLTRLKKRKGDLVDIDGRTITEDPLPQLLGYLDEHSFASRFGLDQEDLKRGAEALLGGSEEGLFSAGTAGADVRGVLAALRESSDEIFKPRGRVLPLNRALVGYDAALRELRRSERPPEKWMEQQRAWEEKVAETEVLKSRRHEVRTELRRLNRLRAQLSDVFAWDEACRRIEQIGVVADLDEQATSDRKTAEMQVAAAGIEAARISSELQQLETNLNGLPEPSLLAEVDDEQLNLSTRVGTALSARNDLPKRRAALISEESTLFGLLSELGHPVQKGQEIEAARGLLVQAGTRRTLGRLLTERGALVTRLAETQKLKASNESELTSLRNLSEDEEPELDLARLEAAVAEAQIHWLKREDLIRDGERQKVLRACLATRRDELGVENSWRELVPHVPSISSARGAVTRYLSRQQKLAEISDQIRRILLEIGAVERELVQEEVEKLPSQEVLQSLRAQRDRLVVGAEASPTSAAFHALRTGIVQVDDTSDGLLREADRVAAVAALRRRHGELSERLASYQEHKSELSALLAESDASHQALVRAMRLTRTPELLDAEEWCASLREMIEQEQELELLNESLVERRRLSEEARRRLSESLQQESSDRGLSDLLSTARTRLRESLEERERRRGRKVALSHLLEKARQIEGERALAEQALIHWEDEWEGALRPLGLGRSTSVHRVQDHLAAVEKMARTLDVAENLLGRIAGMERDTASLSEDVVALAKRHCPQLLNIDPVDAAVELQRSIRTARKEEEERQRLRNLVFERRAELSQVLSKKSAGEASLDRLMVAAGVSAVSELPQVEAEAAELRGLKRLRNELEQRVRASSDGSSPSEIVVEATRWKGRVGALVDKINDLDEENQGLDDELRLAEGDCAGIKLGLDTYRSEDVALARQETERKRADALRLLREYLVRSAAHRLLSQQVTAHAARFAGPVLGRARELFTRLTLGRYTDLDVGFGERTLRCVRDQDVLEVGQLSTGTRAQLYLALRVASLELYFDARPAVPLVFDDLLLEFDDDRATVAFEVLGELSERVQILYFTHLARDIESAENALDSSVLFQHRIGVS